jgi:NAD(P)-dependent dehydrogenase (short-subunit alcohol dehydrogenase family)
MRQRRFGRIILLSSVFGEEPDESYVVSSTFRAGLRAFAKCLAREAGPDGVCTNVVCPGYFDTPLLTESAAANGGNQKTANELLGSWAALSPAKRFGIPSELGSLVAWLASSHASYVNGTAIAIDGGLMKR